ASRWLPLDRSTGAAAAAAAAPVPVPIYHSPAHAAGVGPRPVSSEQAAPFLSPIRRPMLPAGARADTYPRRRRFAIPSHPGRVPIAGTTAARSVRRLLYLEP